MYINSQEQSACMYLDLHARPKNPIILEGFPGYGLVGTIVTEFLIKHLNAKKIGRIYIDEVTPVVAIHENMPIDPLGIFYDKVHNLVILHALTTVQGVEWKLAEQVTQLSKILKAKEVIGIEGVGNPALGNEEPRMFYIGKGKKFAMIKELNKLDEGIIMGVTGALLLREDITLNCILAETHSQLPDSRAAARIVQVLDKYLGLKVDYKPLLKQAEHFETKLRDVIAKSKEAVTSTVKTSTQPYFG